MKFSIAFAAIVGLLLAPAASRAEQAKPNTPSALAKTVKGLVGVHDAMRDITWYKNSASPKYNNTNTFYLYFGISDDQILTPLRLKITYSNDSWLFVKNVWGKADGKKIIGAVPDNSKKGLLWVSCARAVSASINKIDC